MKKLKEIHPVERIIDSEAVEWLSQTEPGRWLRENKMPQSSRVRKIMGMDLILILALLLVLVVVNLSDSSMKTSGKTKENTDAEQIVKNKTEEKGSAENPEGEPEGSGSENKESEPVTITVSATGDCTLGTDEFFSWEDSLPAKYEETGDFSYFFQNVKPVFSEDDLTIVNFEGTLTDSENRADKQFAFKADQSYANILTEGSVEAASLANNHSKDYGEESYADTIGALDEAGIVNFGYDRTAMMEIKGVKIGLVGTYVLAEGIGVKDSMVANIQSLKEQGAQLVIVSFHWGEEKAAYPGEVQKELAHAAVDNGADLVIGHHPHVLQGVEEYEGRNIVYSLGNFCFGGNSYPSDMDTVIFQQTFTFEGGERKEDNVTSIIPCSISSASGYNNYQPTPVQGEEADRILQKLEERSAGI